MSNETTIMFQHETDHRMMIPAVLGFPMCSAEFMCFDWDIYIFVHLSAILPISCYIHHSILFCTKSSCLFQDLVKFSSLITCITKNARGRYCSNQMTQNARGRYCSNQITKNGRCKYWSNQLQTSSKNPTIQTLRMYCTLLSWQINLRVKIRDKKFP